MNTPSASIRISVNPTNPGEFFACCGLLELAARLNPDAEGWFESGEFCLAQAGTLTALISALGNAELIQLKPSDVTASPIQISSPFDLRLDWWKSGDPAFAGLKVWAGTMESFRIARAMQHSLRTGAFDAADLFDVGVVAYDPDDPTKKVEPFYFDARRGPNAHSRDVGFSPNDLSMTTTAFPAVEFLCLIGLQRCRPLPTSQPRVYDYHLWFQPLSPVLLPAAITGLLPSSKGYRFESWYRTGQKKHKAFLTSKPMQNQHE